MEACVVHLQLELLRGILRVGEDWLHVLEYEAGQNLDVLYAVLEVLLNAPKCYRNREERDILRRVDVLMEPVRARGRIRIHYVQQIRNIERYRRDVYSVLGFCLDRVVDFYQLDIERERRPRGHHSPYNAFYKCIKNHLILLENPPPSNVSPLAIRIRVSGRRPAPSRALNLDDEVIFLGENQNQNAQGAVNGGNDGANLVEAAAAVANVEPHGNGENEGGAVAEGEEVGAQNPITYEEIVAEFDDILATFSECQCCLLEKESVKNYYLTYIFSVVQNFLLQLCYF